MAQAHGGYYVPHSSPWPIVASVGLFTTMVGFANFLNGGTLPLMMVGVTILIVMLFGWFGTVISESERGLYNDQVDQSFRWGMYWFIFSEVMFFAAFFGTLWYARDYSVPWLGGAGDKVLTHEMLWPDFRKVWPTNGPQALGGAFQPMEAWGLPAINTVILLSSGMTITWAHWALKENKRMQLILGLAATVFLGFLFVFLQGKEYAHAYTEMNLTLSSGIYGSIFFMLTGFHGLHVTLGATILLVILLRCLRGHFTPERHFAFEAAAWYWHFVDVVWLGLFIVVYWM